MAELVPVAFPRAGGALYVVMLYPCSLSARMCNCAVLVTFAWHARFPRT